MNPETSLLRLVGKSRSEKDNRLLSKIFNFKKLSDIQQALYRTKLNSQQRTLYDEVTLIILREMMNVGHSRDIYLKIFACIFLYISTILSVSFGLTIFTDPGLRLIYKFLIWIGLIKIDANPTRRNSSLFHEQKTIFDTILDGRIFDFIEQFLGTISEIYIVQQAKQGLLLILQLLGLFAGVQLINPFTMSVLGFLLRNIMVYVIHPGELNFFKMLITSFIAVILVLTFYIMLKADIMNKVKLMYMFLAFSCIFLSNWGIQRFTQFLVDQIVNDSSEYFQLILTHYAADNQERQDFINNIRQAGIQITSSEHNGFPVDTFHIQSSIRTENDDLQGILHEPGEHIISRWTGDMLIFFMKLVSKLTPSVSETIQHNIHARAGDYDPRSIHTLRLMDSRYTREGVEQISRSPRHRAHRKVTVHHRSPSPANRRGL